MKRSIPVIKMKGVDQVTFLGTLSKRRSDDNCYYEIRLSSLLLRNQSSDYVNEQSKIS